MSAFGSRLLDVDLEPEAMHNPIQGLRSERLVSLAEAINFLVSAAANVPPTKDEVRYKRPRVQDIQDLDLFVDNALSSVETYLTSRRREEECLRGWTRLTKDEAAAINLYTMQWQSGPSLFQVLNSHLRDRDRSCLLPWMPFLKLLLVGLIKLPNLGSGCASIWRGSLIPKEAATRYSISGFKFKWWAVTSATTTMSVVTTFMNPRADPSAVNVFFAIDRAHTAVPVMGLSCFQHEDEVVLLPGSQFEVKSAADFGGTLHVHIELVNDGANTLQLVRGQLTNVPVPQPLPSNKLSPTSQWLKLVDDSLEQISKWKSELPMQPHPGLLRAFRAIDRAWFCTSNSNGCASKNVSESTTAWAALSSTSPSSARCYNLSPAPLGFGVNMSAPYLHLAGLIAVQSLLGRPSLKALDVGCGTGFCAAVIAEAATPSDGKCSVIGIDHVEEFIALASAAVKWACPHLRGRLEFKVADARRDISSLGMFDIIHVGAAMSHELQYQYLNALNVGGVLVGPLQEAPDRQVFAAFRKHAAASFERIPITSVVYAKLTDLSSQLSP